MYKRTVRSPWLEKPSTPWRESLSVQSVLEQKRKRKTEWIIPTKVDKPKKKIIYSLNTCFYIDHHRMAKCIMHTSTNCIYIYIENKCIFIICLVFLFSCFIGWFGLSSLYARVTNFILQSVKDFKTKIENHINSEYFSIIVEKNEFILYIFILTWWEDQEDQFLIFWSYSCNKVMLFPFFLF